MFAVPAPSRTAVQRLAAARLISVTGNVSAAVALALVLYARTGSAEWVGAALLIAFAVPALVSVVSGMLSDRLDRRLLLICSDLLGAACFAAMALVHAPGVLLALAFVAAVVAAPFLPASGAMVPAVAPAPELAQANSSLAVARNAGTLVGPLVGGGLVALSGASTVFLVNAASFVLSAALIATLRGHFRATAGESNGGSSPLEGMRLILREPVLRALTLGFVFVDIGNGIALPGEVPIAKLFGTGATGYGALVAAWGVGGVVGARGAKAVLDRLEEPPVMVASAALLAACLAAVAAAPWFAVVLIGFAFGGLSMSMAGVGEDVLLQRRVADHVRGRVYAAHMAVIQISLSLPLLVAGLLVDAWGPRVTFGLAAGSVLLGFAALGALLARPCPDARDESHAVAGARPDSVAPTPSRRFDEHEN